MVFESEPEQNFNRVDAPAQITAVSFNKNENQQVFNEIKGTILELAEAEKHCFLLLETGKQGKRFVYLSIRKENFNEVTSAFAVNDKVCVKFYISSYAGTNSKTDSMGTFQKWYTICTLIEIEKLGN